jgi:hypothetical protein
MSFENYFDIFILKEKKITLKEAIKIAKDNGLSEFPYDPLGYNNENSYYYCISLLELLQQEDLIREFEIKKKIPKNQIVIEEQNSLY